ncbi:OmpA family protein [Photobacterium ganghwense]|uniref:MotY family protein n=1 Tax=Photobacterium ganghwense TaxID=320778 RepID=UPI0039EF8EB5
MINKCCKNSWIFLLAFQVGQVNAQNIAVPIDLVKWEYKGDHFQCLLNQKINNFGQVSFIAEPSQKLAFKVESFQLPQSIQIAKLYQWESPWSRNEQLLPVGEARQVSNHELIFNGAMDDVLRAMSEGAWLQLSVSSQTLESPVLVQLPGVHLRDALTEFTRCRAALPAMSYQQARDLTLPFESGQRVASSQQQQILRDIAEYVRLDKSVKRILIDGHTDNVGSSLANLQIARVRADDVASVLEEAGVPESLIQVRAHGARYPVAGNDSELGQANNRRVTVRVIRRQDDKGSQSD